MATRGVNKVILIGNVGNDPDVRYFPNGDGVANFSLATSESWRDKNTGEPQERTEWHRISVRGKLVEVVKQYVHKGTKLYIEGSLRTRKWQDQSGQDRYTTEIVVGGLGSSMQMLDSKGAGAGSVAYDESAGQRAAAAPSGGVRNGGSPGGGYGGGYGDFGGGPSAGGGGGGAPGPDFDDDIPF